MSQRPPGKPPTPRVDTALLRRTGMGEDDLRLVRSAPLFAGLAEAELGVLLRDSLVRQLSRGAVLFLQGDPANRFFVVLSGWVQLVRRAPDGNEVTIALFGRGDSLAEAAVLQLGNYPVTGLVADAGRILIVPAESFLAALKTDSRLCFSLMASMARRLHQFVQQIEQLSSSSTAQRVASFLLRSCTAKRGNCTIELPIDKGMIAARLGMQPESFSRALAKLRARGVTVNGSVIHIESIEHLREFSEGGVN